MKIGVVVVTYNRIEKLKKCLAAYERQTFSPEYVMVVNNCSSDGTGEYLDEWKQQDSSFERLVVHGERNLGGAGGFALGISQALEHISRWEWENAATETPDDFFIWLADDDAYPEPECLQKIAEYYGELPQKEQEKLVALCAKVVDNNGISPLHRRRLKRSPFCVKEACLNEKDYKKKAVPMDVFSFVGTAIRRSVMQGIGLPREEYFIFYDDTEYALRVGGRGQIICIPEAVILHDSMENTITTYSWKNYYMFRNKMYTYSQFFRGIPCFVDRIKILYMIWRYYNVPETWQQYRQARQDAKAGRLGVREEYMPRK